MVDHIHKVSCFRSYISLSGELLSWLALSSTATRASTPREGSYDVLIAELAKDLFDDVLREFQEGEPSNTWQYIIATVQASQTTICVGVLALCSQPFVDGSLSAFIGRDQVLSAEFAEEL
jgi:hypothetical protein